MGTFTFLPTSYLFITGCLIEPFCGDELVRCADERIHYSTPPYSLLFTFGPGCGYHHFARLSPQQPITQFLLFCHHVTFVAGWRFCCYILDSGFTRCNATTYPAHAHPAPFLVMYVCRFLFFCYVNTADFTIYGWLVDLRWWISGSAYCRRSAFFTRTRTDCPPLAR